MTTPDLHAREAKVAPPSRWVLPCASEGRERGPPRFQRVSVFRNRVSISQTRL